MVDRISNFRVVRLAIHLPSSAEGEAHWTLTPLTVKNGVPNGTTTHRGVLSGMGPSPSVDQIADALERIVAEVRPT